MGAVKTRRARLRVCNYALGNVVCSRPAIVAIDRGSFGELRVCAVHMDDPKIYQDVQLNGWEWRVLIG